MDEAEKYQQRLRAIVERRRQQEEEKRLTGETEEEWLKAAQKKNRRKLGLSNDSLASITGRSREQTKSQKTPEDEDEEAADAREEEQASQEENKKSVNYADRGRTHSDYQAGTDEDVQVNTAAEDHVSVQMAQRMFHESGQDGRSVLGMVAVQVERDPKTGASVVRSVAPVSEPAGASPMATAVFDDGRKSIHAYGGSGSQPSTEELGQILSIVDGVGMKVLLDEVTVTPNKPEIKIENIDAAPEEKVLSFSTNYDVSKEDDAQLESSKSYSSEAELEEEDCAASLGKEEDEKEDRVAVRDIAGEVENVEDLKLEEGPVTLVFLGYADADQAQSQEDRDSSMITVERVMITEDGEEHVIGPETSASEASASEVSASETSASPQAETEAKVFQEVPLDGNGVKVQGKEGDKGLHNSSPPATAEGGGTPKRKTCQCCSVM